MAEKSTFRVTMEYLREIIAQQTFGDSPAAALRELIQNAHDACMVASALSNKKGDCSINITLDTAEKTITIQDNGIGMTEDDIHEYLTTIGSGKKGVDILEKFGGKIANKRRLEHVIGEFGFGFIASFIIADEIELWTRSAKENNAVGIHCSFSTKAVAYELEESKEVEGTGTKLVLHLNRKAHSRGLKPTDNPLEGSILSWDTVDAIVKKYCIFLEFPIFVTMEGDVPEAASNQIDIPWENEQRLKERVQRFYNIRVGSSDLGEILFSIRLDLSKEKGDEVNLSGALFIEDAPQTQNERRGNLEVFIKKMWVCEKQQKLLPSWASFIRGMIVTPDLRPMPGRGELDENHGGYEKVKRVLHELISDAFLNNAQKNQKIFNTILDQYGSSLRWGLIHEYHVAEEERRDFNEAELIRYVRFVRYSKKYMNGQICNLNDYLDISPQDPVEFKEKKRVVHIVARPIPLDRQFEFRRLLTSRPLSVFVPNDDSELALLGLMDDIFPGLIVRNIENELLKSYAGLLEDNQHRRWNAFLRYYEELSKDHNMAGADVGTPEPDYMPALILNVPTAAIESDEFDEDVESQSEKEQEGKQTPLIPGVPADIAKLYSQTLVINSRNPTMKKLLEYKEDSELEEVDDVLSICLHECYHMALEASLDSMHSDMLRHHAEVSCTIIEAYLRSTSEQLSSGKVDQDVHDALVIARDELKSYDALFGPLSETDQKTVKRIQIPDFPEERMGVVVLCDMVDSTGKIVGMDFTDRGMILKEFIEMAKKEVETHNGFFDKFTGDGLIAFFGVENSRLEDGEFNANAWKKACRDARQFCQSLNTSMVKFNDGKAVRKIIQRNAPKVERFELRMAISAGCVSFGRFGAQGTAVGFPAIVASRLCDEKEAFKKAKTNLLVDHEFQSNSGMKDLEKVDYTFKPRGLNVEVKIFKSTTQL